MLKVRKEQVEVFQQAAVRNFEMRMLQFVEESFPKHYNLLGKERVHEIIRDGLKRAKSHGFHLEQSVRFYISLMFMLGSSFDTDPQYAWAAEQLRDETVKDETVRIYRLYKRALAYLEAVAGPNNVHLDKALRKIQREPHEESAQKAGGNFVSYMGLQLQRFYPEKYAYLGEEGARALVLRGIRGAKTYGITSERGVTLYIGLMYLLGSQFDTDLQFPWATAALKDESAADEAQRVEKLYTAAMAYLDHWVPKQSG